MTTETIDRTKEIVKKIGIKGNYRNVKELINAKTMSKKRRLGLTLLFMGIFAGLYQAGSLTPVDTETAEALMKEFEAAVEGIDAVGIFAHNAMLSLIMFLPGFGVVWGAIAGFQTGFAFSAATTLHPELSGVPALILFITPFGIMELFAYGIAMSRSYLLIRHAVKLHKIFIKPLVIEVGIVIGLLLVGGFIEDYMIQWAQEMGFDLTEMIT